MLRWQPPPPNSQNGEIINYKIKYRKGSRRSETTDSTSGSQLFKLISGNGSWLLRELTANSQSRKELDSQSVFNEMLSDNNLFGDTDSSCCSGASLLHRD